jgi:hypothetical protein
MQALRVVPEIFYFHTYEELDVRFLTNNYVQLNSDEIKEIFANLY